MIDYALNITCTAAGTTAIETKTCSRCGDKQTRGGETVAALGHNLTSHAAVAATCTTAGNSAYWSCSRCGKYFSNSTGTSEIAANSWVIEATGHSYTAATVKAAALKSAATCTNAAVYYYSCANCGAVESNASHTFTNGAALGHSYGTPSWAWTGNDTDGYTKAVATFTCSRDASHKETVTDNSIDYAVTTEAQPGVEGAGTYTASVTFGGKNYSDTKVVAIAALPVNLATFTHSDNLSHTDTYLYRIGNGNAVALSNLFKVESNTPTDANVAVTITPVSSANATAAGTFTKNSTNWASGTVKFTGEGPVKVTIQEGAGEAYDLYLEVVPGNNYTAGASLSGSPGNVVLLGNVSIPYVNHNGAKAATLSFDSKNLYGNGFTIDATNSSIETMTHGIISLTNAKFDNAVVIGPTFNEYIQRHQYRYQ